MTQRINIVLPKNTIDLLDKATKPGGRSQFITQAVNYYLIEQKKAKTKRLLVEAGRVHAKRDKQLAEEWLNID